MKLMKIVLLVLVVGVVVLFGLGWKKGYLRITPQNEQQMMAEQAEEVEQILVDDNETIMKLLSDSSVVDNNTGGTSYFGRITAVDESGVITMNVNGTEEVIVNVSETPIVLWEPYKNDNGQVTSWEAKRLTPDEFNDIAMVGMVVVLETEGYKGLDSITKVVIRGS